MDSAKLRNEIIEDPQNLGYAAPLAAGSANQIAALLNAPRYDGLGTVDTATMLIWVAKWGVLANLRTAVASDNQALASIAEVTLLMISNPNIPALDLSLPDVQTMLTELVMGDVILPEAANELHALAAVKRSRAAELGLGVVTADDVSRALEG